MYRKTKNGVEIDSQKADAGMKPRFKSARFGAASAPKEAAPASPFGKGKKKFGKKRARAQKAAILLSKARKGS